MALDNMRSPDPGRVVIDLLTDSEEDEDDVIEVQRPAQFRQRAQNNPAVRPPGLEHDLGMPDWGSDNDEQRPVIRPVPPPLQPPQPAFQRRVAPALDPLANGFYQLNQQQGIKRQLNHEPFGFQPAKRPFAMDQQRLYEPDVHRGPPNNFVIGGQNIPNFPANPNLNLGVDLNFGNHPPLNNDLAELNAQASSEEACYKGIRVLFPDISKEHVTAMWQANPNKRTVEGLADLLLQEIEAGRPYARIQIEPARAPINNRKKSEDGNNQQDNQYLAPNRPAECPEYWREALQILTFEFPWAPKKLIDEKFYRQGPGAYFLYPTYLALYELDRQWTLDNQTYAKLKNPRKQQAFLIPGNIEKALDGTLATPAVLKRCLTELKAAKAARARIHATYMREREHERLEKENEDQAKANGTMDECGCCFGDYPRNRMVYCNSQSSPHYFCNACARTNAETQVGQQKFELICMSLETCKAGFSLGQRQLFLDENLTIAIDRIETEHNLREAGIENLESCPFCSYAAEYPPVESERIFRCLHPACGLESCRLCRKVSHIPKTCEEFAKESGADSLRRKLEDAMSEALVRKCNKCKTPFIKTDGCNKITCTKCRNIQCYVCSQDCIPSVNGGTYAHFNDPTRGGKDGNCPLFDSTEKRHLDEVELAQKNALAKVQAEHPEYTENDLKIVETAAEREDRDRRARLDPLANRYDDFMMDYEDLIGPRGGRRVRPPAMYDLLGELGDAERQLRALRDEAELRWMNRRLPVLENQHGDRPLDALRNREDRDARDQRLDEELAQLRAQLHIQDGGDIQRNRVRFDAGDRPPRDPFDIYGMLRPANAPRYAQDVPVGDLLGLGDDPFRDILGLVGDALDIPPLAPPVAGPLPPLVEPPAPPPADPGVVSPDDRRVAQDRAMREAYARAPPEVRARRREQLRRMMHDPFMDDAAIERALDANAAAADVRAHMPPRVEVDVLDFLQRRRLPRLRAAAPGHDAVAPLAPGPQDPVANDPFVVLRNRRQVDLLENFPALQPQGVARPQPPPEMGQNPVWIPFVEERVERVAFRAEGRAAGRLENREGLEQELRRAREAYRDRVQARQDDMQRYRHWRREEVHRPAIFAMPGDVGPPPVQAPIKRPGEAEAEAALQLTRQNLARLENQPRPQPQPAAQQAPQSKHEEEHDKRPVAGKEYQQEVESRKKNVTFKLDEPQSRADRGRPRLTNMAERVERGVVVRAANNMANALRRRRSTRSLPDADSNGAPLPNNNAAEPIDPQESPRKKARRKAPSPARLPQTGGPADVLPVRLRSETPRQEDDEGEERPIIIYANNPANHVYGRKMKKNEAPRPSINAPDPAHPDESPRKKSRRNAPPPSRIPRMVAPPNPQANVHPVGRRSRRPRPNFDDENLIELDRRSPEQPLIDLGSPPGRRPWQRAEDQFDLKPDSPPAAAVQGVRRYSIDDAPGGDRLDFPFAQNRGPALRVPGRPRAHNADIRGERRALAIDDESDSELDWPDDEWQPWRPGMFRGNFARNVGFEGGRAPAMGDFPNRTSSLRPFGNAEGAPIMYSSEDMRTLPNKFSSEDKKRWELRLTELYKVMHDNPEDSQAWRDASKKIREFSKLLETKMGTSFSLFDTHQSLDDLLDSDSEPPQPTMFRPEQMADLPGRFSAADKQGWGLRLAELYNVMRVKPEDSKAWRNAKKMVEDFSKLLETKISQRALLPHRDYLAARQLSRALEEPPEPVMVRPEEMRILPAKFSAEYKQRWELRLTELHKVMQENPEDSEAWDNAKEKIGDFSRLLEPAIHNAFQQRMEGPARNGILQRLDKALERDPEEPQPTMFSPEEMRTLPQQFKTKETKLWEHRLTKLYKIIKDNSKDSEPYQNAQKKIQDFSRVLESKIWALRDPNEEDFGKLLEL